MRRDADNGHAFFPQAVELAAEGMEFAVGGDQMPVGLQGESGEKPDQQVVGGGAERDLVGVIVEEAGRSRGAPRWPW